MARLGAPLAALLGSTTPAYPTGPDELVNAGPLCAPGVTLLISAFENATVLQAVLCSYATRLDALEVAMMQVHYSRWIDTAEGVQLDALGRVIVEPRYGLTDALYLRGLRSRILVNRANGKIEELYAISAAFEPGLDSIEARELPPNAITFWALGATDADPRALALRLRQVSAGGVGLQTVHTPLGSAALHMITSDTTPTTSATQGFGSTTESTGGGLAGVIGQE